MNFFLDENFPKSAERVLAEIAFGSLRLRRAQPPLGITGGLPVPELVEGSTVLRDAFANYPPSKMSFNGSSSSNPRSTFPAAVNIRERTSLSNPANT